ncbi:hypothetical protein [Oribacterium sp. P6A1]|uniref:hypothetical protein n=1 Tax=Oribacterium sp. P6A1 TaxID=1410612 RepID=UPI00056360C5|nr:hypothetical protein [Oribacterium sp. P6A1]
MIVLTILKVIGIVLLVILLLILFLLSIILFVPVRYRSMGYKKESENDYYIDLNASWLLKALRFKAAFDPDGLKMNLKFLWLTLMDSEGDDEESSSDETDICNQEENPGSASDSVSNTENSSLTGSGKSPVTDSESDITEVLDNTGISDDITDSDIPAESDTPADSDSSEIDDHVTDSDIAIDVNVSQISDNISESDTSADSEVSEIDADPADSDVFEQSEKTENTEAPLPKEKRGPSLREKTVEKFRKIPGKIENVAEKISGIKAAITDEENRKALKLIIKNTKYLLKHYRFRSLEGNLTYGSEDPASVGSAMMYLSLLYPVYGENFTIEPVFDRSVICGDMNFKGRIRLIHLLIVLIELMLNKKIRQLVINHL